MKQRITILMLGGGRRVSMAELLKESGKRLGAEVQVVGYELITKVPLASAGKVVQGLAWDDPRVEDDVVRVAQEQEADILIPYSNAAVEKLSLPTQDSRDIIAAACRALNHVWREGYRYMKAGVMLADFTPSGIAQPGLFDEIQPRKNSEKLMKTLDELNQSGKGKVWFAGRGTAPEWQMKREMLSQCYTTKWRDIPLARLG